MRRWLRKEEFQESQGPRVPRSNGPMDKVISKSHSNTSLTLKKVHLVQVYHQIFTKPVIIVVQNADLDLLFTHEKNLRNS